jgi:hypothetical protein
MAGICSAFPSAAGAHDWFDVACCHARDCREISPAELKSYPEGIIWTSARSGHVWKIPWGAVSIIDKKPKIRISPDGRFYGCEQLQSSQWIGDGHYHTPAEAFCLYLGNGS